MKLPLHLFVLAAFVATPLAVRAQDDYTPPKLIKPGSNTSALAGKGSVMVQVFVKSDGTFKVMKVLKSANPGNNAAALEIAKTSKYKPAMRGGKAVSSFYDYALTFAGDTAATGSGPVAGALASIRAGKYDDAKASLGTYLQAHPDDTQANLYLGVANAFAGDQAGAAAAFEKSGTVPDQYKTLQIQAYSKNASALLDQKKFPDAAAYAGKAIALDANNLEGYYVRGVAEQQTQSYAASILDLQKARTIAVAAKSDDKTLATIGFNLAVTQLQAGQYGEAATTGKQVVQLDPTRRASLDNYAYTSVNNPAVELANQGKITDAVSRLESGATAFPEFGAKLLAQAAAIMATDKKPDWKKVAAEADKALAVDPNEGQANFIRGFSEAQQNDPAGALTYINKAKASPRYATDPSLAKQVDAVLKQLNTPVK